MNDFEFWSGAKSRAELLTEDEMDFIEQRLCEYYPEPEDLTRTFINDLFWHEFKLIASWLNLTEQEIYNRGK